MDIWLPQPSEQPGSFRTMSSIRPVRDLQHIARSWKFRLQRSFLPRAIVWPGDDVSVRFTVANESVEPGTIYYLVTLTQAYDGRMRLDSDSLLTRQGNLVEIAAGASLDLQVLLPCDSLLILPEDLKNELLTMSVDIQLWTPRRVRANHRSAYERTLGLVQGMFQKARMENNLSFVIQQPVERWFISYAWKGSDRLGANEHRAWVYRLSDALAKVGVQAIIDFNFMSAALITDNLIYDQIRSADRILVVYSDDYLARIGHPETGVYFEYALLQSTPEIWDKTVPIRRAVFERSETLHAVEKRFIPNFDAGDMTSNVNAFSRAIIRAGK